MVSEVSRPVRYNEHLNLLHKIDIRIRHTIRTPPAEGASSEVNERK